MASSRTPSGREGWQRAQRAARYLVAGGFLLALVAPALAAPSASDMLKRELQPKQDGVPCTVPTADELKGCTVELVKGTSGGSGWILKDAAGNPLRRFFDSNGDNRIDVWSYYKNGVEVYREQDSTFGGKADNYRWMNAGGSKWGVDQDRDGTIDSWKTISPEEVSREVFRALVKRDVRRFQALLINDAEVKALALPAAEAERIGKLRLGSAARFQATVAKMTKLDEKAKWIHLETSVPQTTPAEQTGGRVDVVKHPRGSALIALSDGGNDWVQTGEMIQVGQAWRLIDAPVSGAAIPEPRGGTGALADVGTDPRVQKLIEQLSTLDKNGPTETTGAPVVKHQLARADLLEQVVGVVPPAQREPFIRQVADSLSTAAQAGTKLDAPAFKRLASLEKQLVKHVPGANLTAYVAFRNMQADYSVRIATEEFKKVQQEWLGKLGQFVTTYPKGEDAPDALLQAGLVSEFLDKDVDAKNWYAKLGKAFPDKPQAVKAQGAIRRLELEGKALGLAGAKLDDASASFDVESVKGKVAIVYYWASWNGSCAADFAKLKAVLTANPSTVALVSVNLDTKLADAKEFLARSPAPGTHLHQPGGLEGKLATDYGIMVLPNIFLVGKDGKVASRNAQIGALEEEVKKLLKK